VEGFKGLQEELEAEKRVTMKNWARREKQLERVIANTAGMYGDLSGIIGKSMPAIEHLESPLLTDQPVDDPHFRYLDHQPENHGHASMPAHATPKGK